MLTNQIRPNESKTHHRRQTCDAVNVAQVCIFDVESGGLHGPEAGLNLPTLLIGGNGQLRFVVADENFTNIRR